MLRAARSLASEFRDRWCVRVEARRHRRNGNRTGCTKRSLEVLFHSGCRVTSGCGSLSAGSGWISASTSLLQAKSATVTILALIDVIVALLSPHSQILNGDVCARRLFCADDFDRPAVQTVFDCTLPVSECHVAQLHAIASNSAHRSPLLVDV